MSNEWKETVRKLYDLLTLDQDYGVIAQALDLIEKRHHDYFCEGKPPLPD